MNLSLYMLINVTLIKNTVIQLKLAEPVLFYENDLSQNVIQNVSQSQKCICNQTV